MECLHEPATTLLLLHQAENKFKQGNMLTKWGSLFFSKKCM